MTMENGRPESRAVAGAQKDENRKNSKRHF
jgi:hypothetical protein